MGLSGSQTALMPARVGHMRLGASRVGYYQPTLTMTINGVARYARAVEGLRITDELDGTPNTATFRVSGFTPVHGQEVRIGLGGLNRGQIIFAGHILRVTQIYVGGAANIQYDLFCISYEWLLNRRSVTGKFTATSATDIVLWIMEETSGFTTTAVEDDLPSIDEITFTNVQVGDALDRVAKRIGASWIVDYTKVLHFGLTITPWSSAIHSITTADPHSMEGIAQTVDLSQVRTRIPVTGGGSVTLAAIEAGAQDLPVDDPSWYDADGGTVEVGPQHVTYTDVEIGGDGAIIGTGVQAPTNALTSAAALGAGLTAGDYKYKTTYVTGSGETLTGPESIALTLGGSTTAPSTAPTIAKAIAGNLSAGAYKWKVSYVTAAGETIPGPETGSLTMDEVTAPASAPSAAKATTGNLSAGVYQWKQTYVDSAGGETTPSSASASVTMDSVADPVTIGTASAPTETAGSHTYSYKYTFSNGSVETLPSAASNDISVQLTGGAPSLPSSPFRLTRSGIETPPAGFSVVFYRTKDSGSTWFKMLGPSDGFTSDDGTYYYDHERDTALSATTAPGSSTAHYRKATVTITVSPDANVASRKLYRTTAGGSTFKLVATIANNSATSYADNTADGSLGADAPSSNTAVYRKGSLTAIAVSAEAGVTDVNIYRTQANGSTFKYVATISNGTTTYTDNTADGSLGADALTVSTSLYKQASLTNVPLSPDAAVTERNIWRTVANGSVFKFLVNLPNNTTSTYADSIADGSLGATEPGSDTSGITAADGTVNAGSATIPVSSTTPFASGGGWARIQSQVIRYTGKTTTTLTGVPAAGVVGALASSVRYGSEVLAAPTLTGIPASGDGSILYNIPQGEAVNLYVVREDAAAQTAMAALVGGDGIVEEALSDGRWSQAEAENRGDARLEETKDPLVTIPYRTRDMTTRSGRVVSIDLDAPTSISGEFKVQRVVLSDFGGGFTRPWRTVEVSSRKFSLEAILRLIRTN